MSNYFRRLTRRQSAPNPPEPHPPTTVTSSGQAAPFLTPVCMSRHDGPSRGSDRSAINVLSDTLTGGPTASNGDPQHSSQLSTHSRSRSPSAPSTGNAETEARRELSGVQFGGRDVNQILEELNSPMNFVQSGAVDDASRELRWFTPEQVDLIWQASKALSDPQKDTESRRAAFKLAVAICKLPYISLEAAMDRLLELGEPASFDGVPTRYTSIKYAPDHRKPFEVTFLSFLPILAEWLGATFHAVASTRSKKERNSRTGGQTQDEDNLDRLFNYSTAYLTAEHPGFAPEDISTMIEQLVCICKKTTSESDLRYSIKVFYAIMKQSNIPEEQVPMCLEVLCGTFSSVKPLAGLAADTLHMWIECDAMQQILVRDTLHTFLLESNSEKTRNLNVLRGTLYTFRDCLALTGKDEQPYISFPRLMEGLEVAARKDNVRLDTDILGLCASYLNAIGTRPTNSSQDVSITGSVPVMHYVLAQDWSTFFDILSRCSTKGKEPHIMSEDSSSQVIQSPPAKPSKQADLTANLLSTVTLIICSLETLWAQLDEVKKRLTVDYLMMFPDRLTESQVQLIIAHFESNHYCTPQDPDWMSHSSQIVHGLIVKPSIPTTTRLLSLQLLSAAYFGEAQQDLRAATEIILPILNCIPTETNQRLQSALVSFAVNVAGSIYDELLEQVVDILSKPTMQPRTKGDRSEVHKDSPTPSRPTSTSIELPLPSSAATCAKGLVLIFLRSLNTSAAKACSTFEKMLQIARDTSRPADARLTVLKLLFRIRCESNGSVFVVTSTESESLAAALCRTAETFTEKISVEQSAGDRTSRMGDEDSVSGNWTSSRDHPVLSRSNTRGASSQNRSTKREAPLWMYPGPPGLPEDPPSPGSSVVAAFSTKSAPSAEEANLGTNPKVVLKLNVWLETAISFLQKESDWEVYSYVAVHLGSQLSNIELFTTANLQVQMLRSVLCEHVKNSSFHEPPAYTGVKKSDVAICMFNILTMLIAYHDNFSRNEQDEIVRSLMLGIGSVDDTSRVCVHALSVCCHEIPLSVTRSLTNILDKMSKIITQAHLAVHVLEFLAGLARLPEIFSNFREEEIRTVFGVCIRYLQTAREHRAARSPALQATRPSQQPSARHSGGVKELATASIPESMEGMPEVPQYVYALTYDVMIFWFLSLKLPDRAKHAGWIIKRLVSTDDVGREGIEEQSRVFIDMMQRTAYSDLGETKANPQFASVEDGTVAEESWLIGLSIVTIQTAGATGCSQIIKRQASGTTHASYHQYTADLPAHHVPVITQIMPLSDGPYSRVASLPDHILLQLTTTADPVYPNDQPIPLPQEEFVKRAIRSFDLNDTVDGHKVGIVYVGPGQTEESHILANTTGSHDFEQFLDGLGTKVPLRGAKFNTQGLSSDIDGEFTYAWRDRVSEIVFHVPIMMPTDSERDPNCTNKKRHIGNDFVNIVFNRSNLPFDFNTIPSQFNAVNIVISPSNRLPSSPPNSEDTSDLETSIYRVQVVTKADFPELSPASDVKLVSGIHLASFVRLIALNASVFSLVWDKREGGEYVSSWRNRLREIRQLRDRVIKAEAAASEAALIASSNSRTKRSSLYPEDRSGGTIARSTIDYDSTAHLASLYDGLNFSKWTGRGVGKE